MRFNIKTSVKDHYGKIARSVGKKSGGSQGCCGTKSCSANPNAGTLYREGDLKGLPETALEASLGCANPLVFAGLKEGETVLDLGSGGGIDVLMASKHVGASGKVYGLDMTDDMLALAEKNKKEMGVTNVEFLKGYLEEIPLPDETVDVIMSNCVINLSDDKKKAVSEAYRVLKPGGRLAVADIVSIREIPAKIRQRAKMWSSCLGGTLLIDDYTALLRDAGFLNIEIEPVHIYTREIIEELAESTCFKPVSGQADLKSLDGAFAGAHIRAVK